jgi:UDPglucose--hexose-1-phosphate uridylyltransferase
MQLDLLRQPHRRFNPLTREWIIVSAERITRPWLGHTEKKSIPETSPYDPKCYLCPGNTRLDGTRTPNYTGPFAFDNAFPVLRPNFSPGSMDRKGLLVAESESGMCRVVSSSHRHDLTLAEMSAEEISKIVDVWIMQMRELSGYEFVGYVQIFENKGELVGCGYPHPHSQIFASQTIPNQPSKEQLAFADYLKENSSCLLCDYLALELGTEERQVCANDHFVSLVPFWSIWPFETLVLTKRHVGSLLDLNGDEKNSLANILRRVLTRYDNLFEAPMPYTLGLHQKPVGNTTVDGGQLRGDSYSGWHLHIHIAPPVLRSPTIVKYMAGYEMFATPIRDVAPEWSAERLRICSEIHYRSKSA